MEKVTENLKKVWYVNQRNLFSLEWQKKKKKGKKNPHKVLPLINFHEVKTG